MATPETKLTFKILLIGDSGVGKTCLLLRFADDYFTSSFIATIGVDFKLRHVKIDGKRVKLHIFDTAGQDRFKVITSAYYRSSHGIVVVYSITDATSFEHVKNWLREIANFGGDDVQKLLIGNKNDLESQRKVSKEEAIELAEKLGIPLIETSAKDATNVDEAFMKLAEAIVHSTAPVVDEPEAAVPWNTEPANKCACSKN